MLRSSCIIHFRQHFEAKAIVVVVFGVGAYFAAMSLINTETVMDDVTKDYLDMLEDCCSSCSLLQQYLSAVTTALQCLFIGPLLVACCGHGCPPAG